MDSWRTFRVSAIVPVYNAEQHVAKAVRSLLVQDFIVEVILVEDGSKDRSLDECRALVSLDSRVKLLRHPNGSNRGACASRNLGLRNAQGEWIQFLDADDELLPGKLQSNYKVLTSVKEADLIVGKYFLQTASKREEVRVRGDVWAALIDSRLGCTCSNLWRKAAVDSVHGWNENLKSSQEYDLMFRLLGNGAKVAFDAENNTVVHQQRDSISTSIVRRRENAINRIALRIDIYEFLKSNSLLNAWRSIMIHGYINKNLGYLPDRNISFRVSWLYATLYKLLR